MAKVKITNINKYFGALKCLDMVNLEIENGELVVIVGPSGCGKSTLLRCIAGLEKPSDGSIFIDGESVSYGEPQYGNVAMVFQYYALYPHMTVRKNLSFGLEHTTKLNKFEIQKKVEEISNILKINSLLDRKPKQLSGGEAQRVAMGRALVRRPKVFLLDEPLSAIDAKLRRELRIEFKKIQRDFNITTLYVTHDQEEAMALGDKIIVMCNGVIHQVGTPEEVFNRPKDQFVAGFFGTRSMNFFKLEIKVKEDSYYLKNNSFNYQISKEYFSKYLKRYVGKTVMVGVRPSSIKIIPRNSKYGTVNINTARVLLIENTGTGEYIYANIDLKKIIIETKSENVPILGEVVMFSFNEEDIYLFDLDNKESIILNN